MSAIGPVAATTPASGCRRTQKAAEEIPDACWSSGRKAENAGARVGGSALERRSERRGGVSLPGPCLSPLAPADGKGRRAQGSRVFKGRSALDPRPAAWRRPQGRRRPGTFPARTSARRLDAPAETPWRAPPRSNLSSLSHLKPTNDSRFAARRAWPRGRVQYVSTRKSLRRAHARGNE